MWLTLVSSWILRQEPIIVIKSFITIKINHIFRNSISSYQSNFLRNWFLKNSIVFWKKRIVKIIFDEIGKHVNINYLILGRKFHISNLVQVEIYLFPNDTCIRKIRPKILSQVTFTIRDWSSTRKNINFNNIYKMHNHHKIYTSLK